MEEINKIITQKATIINEPMKPWFLFMNALFLE